MAGKRKIKKARPLCLYCMWTPLVLTLVQRRFMWRYHPIATLSRCELFKHFTEELMKLADWLQECRIQTVVMESTGVYWIPLMQILESRGLEVYLVNARYAKTFRAGKRMSLTV